jgi:hypothetical protein
VTTRFALVRRVGALARLPDRRRREEVERELSDHLEDLIEEARRRGYDETMAGRMAPAHSCYLPVSRRLRSPLSLCN